ncbi:MAG: hypothetical protein FWD46_02380 [Cystobacterineae bacterium]|nr:hypothetical protein [Cystobacterineae bacterium]
MCRRILSLLWVTTALWALPSLAQKQELGAKLPEFAAQVGKGRFRTSTTMEAVLKFYSTTYPPAAYPRIRIVNQPNVRAFHIQNPNPKKGSWAGMNIYETQGEIRIFVVPAEKPQPNPPPAKKNPTPPKK